MVTRKAWVGAGLAAALLSLAVMPACKNEPAKPPTRTADRRPMVEVIAAPAADGAATLDLIASVGAVSSTAATADIGGTVMGILVTEGQVVAAGDVIARVSGANATPRASAGLDPAAASELRAAEADLAKLEPLYAQGFVTKPRYDRARTRVSAARARSSAPAPIVPIAAPSTSVYAPVGGTIASINLATGGTVSAGQAVAMIDASDGGIRALTMDPLALRLIQGMAARIIPSGEASIPIDATVAIITPQMGSTPPAFVVDFALPAGATLAPGTIAKISVAIPDGGGKTLAIPLSAAVASSPGLKDGSMDAGILIHVVGPNGMLETVRMMLVGRTGNHLLVAGPLAKGALVLADARRAALVAGQVVRPQIIVYAGATKNG
jgi:RND family efflux transporter MFP subunit